MTPRVTSAALLALFMAAPAMAAQVTVQHTSNIDGGSSSSQQTSQLNDDIEFDAIGSYFIDVEDDAEAFIMIVLDDIDETLSPLGANDSDEYRFSFGGTASGEYEIAIEGSTEALADNAVVEMDGDDVVVVFGPGAEVVAGNRLVVSFIDITADYSDGDIVGGTTTSND